jgi:TorA maturation chaperone TorD
LKVQSTESKTARAVIYRFLSRCFSHPDRELIELFGSARIQEFLQSWRYLDLDAEEAVTRITNWLAQYPDCETALLELDKEYTRLFITAYPKAVAPPYSSVYLDKERLVWGQSTAGAAKSYEAAGLGISKDFHDIPDHIAAELEFVSYLILEQQRHNGTEADKTQEMASIERKFLKEHLCKWAPLFLGRVGEYSRVAFYSTIARLAQKFIDYESKQAQTSE